MANQPNSRRESKVGIIPSRIASEEVHAKVLVDLGGKTVLQHVYERVVAAGVLDDVLIAADHEQILRVAESFGAPTFMTRQEHVCGTDRCAEAAREVFPDADFVINIQADEPFLNPQMVSLVLAPLLSDRDWDLSTLACRSVDTDDRDSPFTVKIARDASTGRALYFSRAVIPYPRYPQNVSYLQHIGIYAFRMAELQRFAALGPSTLEMAEGLEQLRALEAEMRVKVTETDLEYARVSIDTQADIDKARQLILGLQRRTGG